MRKIEAEVFYFNEPSHKIVKRLGFKKIGKDKKNIFWEKKLK